FLLLCHRLKTIENNLNTDVCMCVFFFSSRRRHTRFSRDWSSDVCSSDLADTLSTGSVDFAALSQRIAADRQQRESAETNRDFDEELLGIFLEEADELLAGIDEDLNTWSKKQDDTTSLNNLMRHLHTLKGGANMIAASHIGLIAHELESIYERVIRQQIAVTP